MNSEEKDIAVAKAIGLYDRFVIVKHGTFYRPDAKGYTYDLDAAWKLPEAEAKKHECVGPRVYDPVTIRRAPVPKFGQCLNAMALAEKFLLTLDDGGDAGCARYRYAAHLYRLVEDGRQPLMATAVQRREAFGRTLSLW